MKKQIQMGCMVGQLVETSEDCRRWDIVRMARHVPHPKFRMRPLLSPHWYANPEGELISPAGLACRMAFRSENDWEDALIISAYTKSDYIESREIGDSLYGIKDFSAVQVLGVHPDYDGKRLGMKVVEL